MEIGLVDVLRATWVAATLPILIALIPSSRLNSFRELVLGFAKRGKIMQSSSNKFSVPQKLFCHFYALAVVWTTFLLLTTWFYAHNVAPLVSEPLQYSTIATHLTGGSNIFSWHKSRSGAVKDRYRVWQCVFLLLLMEVQALRRLFETFHVFNYSPSARMHIFGYLTGLFFYTAAPLSLCCTFAPEAIKLAANHVAEFIVKGKNQIPRTEFDWWEFVSPLIRLRWYSWIGMTIFFWGWIHQRRCHAILVANLVFAAAETHRWYLRKFDNYPRDRRIIVPLVY